METVTLRTKFAETGAKALTVSALALGIANYGPNARTAENFAQMDLFCSLGGTLIDTALVYGTWIDETMESYSEKILGKWLSERDNADAVIISTKGAHYDLATGKDRVTAEDIRCDIAASRAHLQGRTPDLYFLHRDDRTVSVSMIMDELNRHAEKGEIGLLGASNWTAARIYAANDYCVAHHMRGFDVSQICFNIMRITPAQIGDTTLVSMTDAEASVYRTLDMPVMAYTSQANGFVQKFLHTPDAEIHHRFADAGGLSRLHRIRIVCEARGISGTAVTLGYLRGQSLTVIPVIGASKNEQLTDSVSCADTRLTPEEIAFIDGN